MDARTGGRVGSHGGERLPHEYQLLRNVFFKQTKLGQEVHTKSELIQLDLKGTVLQGFVLYDWRRLESGD